MSLPRGIRNQPAVVESHPKVVVALIGWIVRGLILLLPLLVLVAAQVPGTALRYECTELQEEITRAGLERRRLLAEKAALLSPERLRTEAERLGLAAPMPGDGPWPVAAAHTVPRDLFPLLPAPEPAP